MKFPVFLLENIYFLLALMNLNNTMVQELECETKNSKPCKILLALYYTRVQVC